MNSGDLAARAGVTVRALRHYHQIGVLPEPPRASNGYRRYGVRELIRVLQIKRLTALGVPLERIPQILDGTDGEATPVLDDLERELTSQIERLTAQREVVAWLRTTRSAPDLPPELADFHRALDAVRTSPEATRMDREQTSLLAHLVGPDGMPQLMDLYSRISSPEMLPAVARLTARFDELHPEAGQAEVEQLVDELTTVIAPLAHEFGASWAAVDVAAASPLVREYGESTLNAAQQRALAMLEARLGDVD